MNPAVDKYIARQTLWQQAVLKKIRQLLHRADPKVEEQIKWGSPWFGHNGQQVAWMFCAKEWVHFSFSQGALLDHNHGLFEETENKAMRTIKFREGQPIPEDLIIKLAKEAVKLNEAGKKVDFNVPKAGSREFDPPHELEEFLRENGQWEEYLDRPYYQQKGWAQWIEQGKKPATQHRRRLTMLKELHQGTYMPPKKQR